MRLAAAEDRASAGRARVLQVWDPLVRAIHWSLALVILLNGAVTDPESALHENLGWAAAGLVATRLLWGLIGPGASRLRAFAPSPRRALAHLRGMLTGERVVHLSHNPLGALMVWNIWATVAGMAATGWMMGTIAFFGVEWVEELHEALFDWLLLSVALHVGGVLLDTRRTGVPLVRAMIDGRKRLPPDARIADGNAE